MTTPRRPAIRLENCDHNPGLAPGAIALSMLPNPMWLAHDGRTRVWRAALALPLALLALRLAVPGSVR